MHEYERGDTAKKKKEWVVLNEAARSAFHKLKKAVMSAQVLTYPDPRYKTQLFFQTYLLGCHFKVCMDNNPLMYFLTSPNMDATKQRWINELMKYDFSLEYQKGKNNTVADALSKISEECFSDEEAEKVLEAVPVIPGDDTIFEVFKDKDGDQQPKAEPHTMSSKTMKAIFNNLTSGAGRRAKLKYCVNSAAHHEANSIKMRVKTMRLSMQMHVTD